MNRKLAAKKDYLSQRARIVQAIRAFFIARDFLEVDTPQRIPANAPEPYITPLPSGDWQLQTSPELAMKRLLAAGYERIFQICHCWRDEERGSRHLPEFTMLEWYRAHADYRDLMQDCEQLIRYLIPQESLCYQGQQIDLSSPFERLSVAQAFTRYTRTSVESALREDCFDELLVTRIEPALGKNRPTILYDYPAELAALARVKSDTPELAERFELYIAGVELANAFSELTEAQEQRRRFKKDAAQLEARLGKKIDLPEKFLAELSLMPPSAGIALGLDRLVMLLTDAQTLDQITAFPPETL